jgi:hypothetical protein
MRAPRGRIYFDLGEPVVIEGVTPAPEDVDMSKAAFDNDGFTEIERKNAGCHPTRPITRGRNQ